MKTTFLVYKDTTAKEKELCVATHDEWDAILKANRGLPCEQRRYFILDCIEDNNQLDCMYIETSFEEYKTWHSKHIYKQRLRAIEKTYIKLSLDFEVPETNGCILYDAIPNGTDFEKELTDEYEIEQLRKLLQQWKPWANELLDYYLEGKKASCTKEMSRKLGISEQTMRKRKKEFESIVATFLSN